MLGTMHGRSSVTCLLVGLGIAALCSCKGTTSPTGIFGTYRLTGCQGDTTVAPLPCVLAYGAPGDDLKVYGGSFTLRSDFTWTSIWDHAPRVSGVWSAETIDSLTGTLQGVAGNDSTFEACAELQVTCSGVAVIRGGQVELYDLWLYKR